MPLPVAYKASGGETRLESRPETRAVEIDYGNLKEMLSRLKTMAESCEERQAELERRRALIAEEIAEVQKRLIGDSDCLPFRQRSSLSSDKRTG